MELDDFKGRPCIKPFSDEGYKSPSQEEVIGLIDCLSLSQREVALITGVSYNDKGSGVVRRWKADPESSNHRAIPYSAWRLLIEYSGLSDSQETKLKLAKIGE